MSVRDPDRCGDAGQRLVEALVRLRDETSVAHAAGLAALARDWAMERHRSGEHLHDALQALHALAALHLDHGALEGPIARAAVEDLVRSCIDEYRRAAPQAAAPSLASAAPRGRMR